MPTDPTSLPTEFWPFQRAMLCAQRAWSFLNHGSTILVILFGALAALAAKDDALGGWLKAWAPISPSTVAAILSALAAVLTAVRSQIGFERKWVTARLTRSALDQMATDAQYGLLDASQMAARFNKIRTDHDAAVVGAVGTNAATLPGAKQPSGL